MIEFKPFVLSVNGFYNNIGSNFVFAVSRRFHKQIAYPAEKYGQFILSCRKSLRIFKNFQYCGHIYLCAEFLGPALYKFCHSTEVFGRAVHFIVKHGLYFKQLCKLVVVFIQKLHIIIRADKNDFQIDLCRLRAKSRNRKAAYLKFL